MSGPAATVKSYIAEMYDWETDAASGMTFGIMDAGCPADMDLTILESKMEGIQEDAAGVGQAYLRIARQFLTHRHRDRQMSGFGSPPEHDPEIEVIVGDPLVFDEEAHVNTRENDSSGSPRERFYRLKHDGDRWRIDGITEKTNGELFELLD